MTARHHLRAKRPAARSRTAANAVWAAFAAACLLPGVAQAAVANSFEHFLDTYNSSVIAPGGDIGPQASPIDYDFPYQSVHWQDKNFGEVYANVHAGTIGIYARAYNNGQYAPQRQETAARSVFDVVFQSPNADPIDVVMNLELSGVISLSGQAYSAFGISAGAVGRGASGGTFERRGQPGPGESPISGSGMLAGFVDDGSKHGLSTAAINVPVNVPVTMFIAMSTLQGYHPGNPTLSFGDTFSLATSGNVFTILGPNAASITVESTDAGIVDNRFVAAVPLPAAAWLLAGVVVPLLRKRRAA